ncbi:MULTISPECIES: Lrp/AsnC ligand binding domain-containing protein [Pseudomonas syringae group]|uniref:Lrp/AsnC ligand binding domain-containing protein n=1 Tax=Pseudomonas syringae group TaxID=136849 RepID=UPI000F0680AE|nr:Lrp/AsnC ligand binding domain-containing protein [Pseudomonas viridiflava]MBD8201183.1 Lrp/AsnC ligand binding domain-containing protein [Pseudomonas viridiflava]TKJ69232.1 hypothetical protein PviCFBP13507_02440 [Pseudomonas viridiflava]TKK30763.1 hypothetical protein PviCFBP13515_06265 [Pseudomonas viridiflava]
MSSFTDAPQTTTLIGRSCKVFKVRARDTQTLEALLGIIHGIEGIEATRSSIALSTYLERGPSPMAD